MKITAQQAKDMCDHLARDLHATGIQLANGDILVKRWDNEPWHSVHESIGYEMPSSSQIPSKLMDFIGCWSAPTHWRAGDCDWQPVTPADWGWTLVVKP